jgi:hypothetical protein
MSNRFWEWMEALQAYSVAASDCLPMLVDGLRSMESPRAKREEMAVHSVTPGDKENG